MEAFATSWHEEHLFCSIIWLYKAKVPFDSGHLTYVNSSWHSVLNSWRWRW